MLTDTEIKLEGIRALSDALGDIQAERFVALVQREPFDYAEWQKTLWPGRTVDELSRAAMEVRAVKKIP